MGDRRRRRALAMAALLAVAGCRGGEERGALGAAASPAAAPSAPPAPVEPTPEPAPEATPLPEGLAPMLAKPFSGDLDAMVRRRVIRVLTVRNPILYFVDRGREAGLTYEALQAFEKEINKAYRLGVGREVHVVPILVARDELLPGLVSGKGDIAAAMLTATPERRKLVDFSAPFATGVRDVLVTGPKAPAPASVAELSGRAVFVRPSSSVAERLRRLNERFVAEGRPPVTIDPVPETLEDGDVLEMVAAGLADATGTNEAVADLYVQLFPGLRKSDAVASAPAEVAWAFRKGSPQLAKAVNAFVAGHRQGTLAGNVVLNRYLKSTDWARNARSDEDLRRFRETIGVFRKYAEQFRIDYLLAAAQGYQESGLDQSKRSRAGAVGILQVLPSTARDPNVNVPRIDTLDGNVHAGLKYDRWVIDRFFGEPGVSRLDRMLLAFAAYNAGPSRVAGLRREAKAQGLDPNRWFLNVETVAARRIGRETVTYVANIYKYYLAYRMMVDHEARRAAAVAQAAKRAPAAK